MSGSAKRNQKTGPRFSEAQRIRKTYRALRSVRRVASALGLSKDTVYRALRDGSVELERGTAVMPVKTGPRYFGHVSDWLRRHDTRKIPRDLDALALVIGVSKNSVKCYLYRRRKEVKDRLLTIPDLRNERILLTDITGETYRGNELTSYEYHVDRFSLHIGITAVSKARKTNPVFEVPVLSEFVRSVKEVVR